LRVEWDDAKNVENQRKHGISFEEAQQLFLSGTDYLEIFDRLHSDDEDRFLCIGPIPKGLVLVVKTEPDEDVVRIVSARLATAREKDSFRRHMEGNHE
jgi:uncharacterized DUF497 family protein